MNIMTQIGFVWHKSSSSLQFHIDFYYIKFLQSQEYYINRVIAQAASIAAAHTLLNESHLCVFMLLIIWIL